MIRTVLSALMCALVTIPSAQAQTNYKTPSDIPVEAFAALPTFSGAKLSPNGQRVGFFTSIGGRKHLVLQNLNGTNRDVIPPGEEKTEFRYFFWKTNDIIVAIVGQTLRRMEFRSKTSESRVISYNFAKKEFKWLGKPSRRNPGDRVSQIERIVDYLPNDPEHILLQLDFKLDASPDVYRVNISNVRRKKVRNGKKGVNNWFSDQSSEIRLGMGYRPGSADHNTYYRTNTGKWLDLENVHWAKKYDIIGFTKDPNLIYVQGQNEHGTLGLFTLNIEAGEIVDHIFSHPSVDVSGMFYHPVTEKLAGVSYIDHFEHTKYFDKDFDILQRSLARALKGEVVSVVNKARDAELYLVYAESDTNPGDYYFYNRPERNLGWITSVRADIDPNLMAKVEPLKVPMRDGSEINVYLTKPKDRQLEQLPTVILPHGGPHARDTSMWDWWAQFYASRGYLVLQPNFRGSDGYGPSYKEAGEHQWGGLMQDDITDATKWLIAKGYSDEDRICIAGASYGGYAALMGTIKEPSLYKCAISVNGVTDLPRMKSHDRFTSVGGKDWTKTMGLKGVDDKEVSPYDRANEINVPVLLISSKDDTRIPYQYSKDMHKKLKKLKKESTYVMLKNGTHSMLTAESRLITLRETEKFLAKHIGEKSLSR